MDLQTLAGIGEFLGGIGVIVTLVFLIRETRINTQAVRASSFHDANASLGELNLRIAENPDLGALVAKGFDPAVSRAAFTDEEWIRFGVFCRSMFNRFESMHIQYQQGLLPKDLWAKRMGTCKWFVTQLPSWKHWWEEEIALGIQLDSFVEAVNRAEPMSGAASYA